MTGHAYSVPTTLQFESTEFQLIEIDGAIWVRGSQIAQALGYSHPMQAAQKLYQRNASEFTQDMTVLVPIADLHPQTGDAGQVREVRVFSPRGAHLMAMLARTKIAADFRQWVLGVLETAVLPSKKEDLTAMQELRLIMASVRLMDRITACPDLDMAETLYLRLMKVNRRLDLQTISFFDLALAYRQRRLDLRLAEDTKDSSAH